MKYLTFLLILSVGLFSCKPTAKEALAYNDKITVENNKIFKKYDKLIESYNEYKPKEMDKAYSDVKNQISKSLNVVKKLDNFAGDSTFKHGAVVLFSSYLSVIDNEHKRIIELLKLPDDQYQDKEKQEHEKLIESANKKIDEETQKLHKIQQAFLKPYKNISLVQDK